MQLHITVRTDPYGNGFKTHAINYMQNIYGLLYLQTVYMDLALIYTNYLQQITTHISVYFRL